MKTKILITALITLTAATLIKASEAPVTKSDEVYTYGSQQVVVNNYYSSYGYEYASRLRRFHNTYVSFDFYSPVYTEVYWYDNSPGSWGVSIYEPWYSYSNYSPEYYVGSGFGGSYWWGYNYWSSYGWNSWRAPAQGLNISIHIGNIYRNYPAYYNRWYSGSYINCCCPVSNAGNNYYPSQPYPGGSSPRFTVTGGRSSGSQTATSAGGSGNTQGSSGGGNQVTGNSNGNQGNSTGQSGNDRDKSNNGLRMGQYRRGVAEPTAPKPNEPARTNNPNVNDRTNPGRDKSNNAKPKDSGTTAAPAGTTGTRQQTQGTVKTSTAPGSKTISTRTSTAGGSEQKESSTQKSGRRSSDKTTESKPASDDTSKKTSSSSGRRL